ncbi:MAG: hypothetical protein ACI4XC_09430 [Eubacterium sp.]
MSENSHDTKGNIRVRAFLSFVLCVLIVLFSLSFCFKTVFTNASYIERKLTSFSYVNSYREDITAYASDCFIKNGIPDDNLENVITQEKAQELAENYINSILRVKVGITADTVSQSFDLLRSDIDKEIKQQIENTDYAYDENTAQNIAQRISDYASQRLNIQGASYIEAISNIGSVASTVAFVLLAIFSIILAVIIYFVGAKRYRSVRAIGISFMSAGFFDLFLSLIVIIISKVKSVDIFPLYLRQAFMSYVYGSIGAVALAGGILLLVSLVFITFVWKMKRDEK